jgi:hypothetical protein
MQETPDVVQAMAHALFFGLPLGLMLAAGERREASEPDFLVNPV